jgi:RNA polymerase sigma-70 factor (ECF subfamily)
VRAGPGGDVFAEERPRLLGLAYRMVAVSADAEDVVQEAWLRWSKADQGSIDNPQAWLTTVTTRLALDRIRAVQRRREVYVGPWLPDPVSSDRTPAERVELAESLTLGFLVLLDRLDPVERAVFLLADVFDEPYSMIAEAVGKSEAACRQVASRARRKLRETAGDPDRPAAAPAPAELLGQLLGAFVVGDEEAALRLLAPDVVLVSDGGPRRHAARRPVVGSYRVHRLLSGGWRLFGFKARPAAEEFPPARLAVVNAGPAIVVDSPGGPIVISGEARDGRITHIWVRLNPEKVSGLDRPLEML